MFCTREYEYLIYKGDVAMLNDLNIKKKSVLIICVITILLVGQMLVVNSKINYVNKSFEDLSGHTFYEVETIQSLRIAVIQIQQWLTDASATKETEALEIAEEYFDEAKAIVAEIIEEEKSDKDDKELIESLTTLNGLLDEYYALGITMANTYISEGTEAGNRYMILFDPFAERIDNELLFLVEHTNIIFNEAVSRTSSDFDNFKILYLGLSSVVLIFVLVSLSILIISILKPLMETTYMLDDLIDGNGDLTKRISIIGNDEMGNMSNKFNIFISHIHDVVVNIFETSKPIQMASEKLMVISQDSSQANQEIAQAIEQVAQIIAIQNGDIDSLNTEIVEIGSFTERIRKIVNNAFSLSKKTDDLSKTGLSLMEELNKKTEATTEKAVHVTNIINEINKYAINAEEITALINSVSHQTNLLALNASIEAARAGEAGKGFSVVADEIKKLALQTSDATSDINELISNIQNVTIQAVELMNEAGETVYSQNRAIKSTEEVFEKTSDSLTELVENIGEISEMSDTLRKNNNEVTDKSRRISAAIEEISASVEEITASTQEQLYVIAEIENSSASSKEAVDELTEQVSKFKVS